MNKIVALLFTLILLNSCKNEINKPSNLALVNQSQKQHQTKDKINIGLSKIHWKGTKMRGLGKHEGEVNLKEGYFLIEENKIVGGKFIIEMNTINVTDIPKHETVPRRI